jgi:hypothetical protein
MKTHYHSNLKINNAQDIMNDIIRYIHKYDYDVNFDEETLHSMQIFKMISYNGKTGRIEKAENIVCIEAEDKFTTNRLLSPSNKIIVLQVAPIQEGIRETLQDIAKKLGIKDRQN